MEITLRSQTNFFVIPLIFYVPEEDARAFRFMRHHLVQPSRKLSEQKAMCAREKGQPAKIQTGYFLFFCPLTHIFTYCSARKA